MRTSALRGARHMAAIMFPAGPFGIVLGAAVGESARVPDLAGWLSAPVVFAGAAQLTAVTLLASGAALFPVVLAGVTVNLRHLMYSAAIAARFRDQPRWFRWLAPYLLVDQMFALVSTLDEDRPDHWRAYYLGAGAAAMVWWMIVVAVGILLGPVLPAWADLEFAAPAVFIGLLVPSLVRRPAVAAAATGALVSALLASLPNRGGLMIGSLAGVLVGYLAEGRE